MIRFKKILSVILAVTTITAFSGFSPSAVWADEEDESDVLPDGDVTGGTSSDALPDGDVVDGGTLSDALPDGILMYLSSAYGGATMSDAEIQKLLDGNDSEIVLAGVTVSTSLTVSSDKTILLYGKNTFNGKDGAALTVKAGASVTVIAGEDSDSTFNGDSEYAGIEVAFTDSNSMGSLTIDGSGTVKANGGKDSAGIGGSYKGDDVYGNITIDGGEIIAIAGSNGAGIGSAYSNGSSGSSRSYKPDAKNWGKITINGGNITATGSAGCGAGIGGGSHVDGGDIEINNGSITAKGSSGIGAGLGSSKNENGAKGPGYVNGGHIVINGGTIAAESNGNGAGIGGGEYSDSGIIEINGGDITARGHQGSDNNHHGGAGIGGGYEGEANITITGGTIKAYGAAAAAGIGSGGTPNFKSDRKKIGKTETKYARGTGTATETLISISGGDITSTGGSKGGAGIGEGAGGEETEISISGGTIKAYGASSDRNAKQGGAGIGSGYYNSDDSYHTTTAVSIAISQCTDLLAIGGWGACGIGSGAGNVNSENISIGQNTKILAEADGTKFAIDTKPVSENDRTPACAISDSENLLQGTFVDLEDTGITSRRYESLSVQLKKPVQGTPTVKAFTLKEGYRSFSANVANPGDYLIYSDTAKAKGYFVYNTEAPHEFRENDGADANTFRNTVKQAAFTDSYWLYLGDGEPEIDPAAAYSLTVKYVDADTNETIASDYVSPDNVEGTSYDATGIAGKTISGYDFVENDIALNGTFSADVVITSSYRKTKTTPENPETPTEPVPSNPIPSNPTPLNPTPAAPSNNSGSSSSSTSATTSTVSITPESTPLVKNAESSTEPATEEITDNQMPLSKSAGLPKTGEPAADMLSRAGMALLALFAILLMKKIYELAGRKSLR